MNQSIHKSLHLAPAILLVLLLSNACIETAPSSGSPTTFITNGLVLWLDANDVSTVTKDGSDKISSWEDKSGNANDALQITAGSQPTYVLNSINSKAAISFDGTDDFFKIADSASLKPDEITIFVVANARAYTSYAASFINKTSNYALWNDGYGLNFMEYNNPNEFQFWVNSYWINAAPVNSSLVTLNQYHLWTGLYGNDLATFKVDKSVVATDTTSAGVIVNSTRAMTIGANYDGTLETVINDPLDGEIAEILIYGRALSESEITIMESYLSKKWGL